MNRVQLFNDVSTLEEAWLKINFILNKYSVDVLKETQTTCINILGEYRVIAIEEA